MYRKLRILYYWFSTEPCWIIVMIALAFSVFGIIFGIVLAGKVGAILSAVGGVCAGSLATAAIVMIDRAEEIGNSGIK